MNVDLLSLVKLAFYICILGTEYVETRVGLVIRCVFPVFCIRIRRGIHILFY